MTAHINEPVQALNLVNICLSGGAPGADEQWGMCAGARGDAVYHFSYTGHRIRVPEAERVVLPDELLREADPHLERANSALERRLPYQKRGTINLLRRNYFQARDTGSIYAVAGFSRDPSDDLFSGFQPRMTCKDISGGSAWACQMFVDRFAPGTPLPLYLFDQVGGQWYEWKGAFFARMPMPPIPQGIWTGIGTRDLNTTGKEAIRSLLGYTGISQTEA